MSYASDLLAFMQYGGANRLGEKQLGETGREFDITSGLQKEQLGEGRRQFDITSGLSRAQWEAENALRLRQMGLTEQQVKQQLQLSREKAARDVGQQAFENHQRLVDRASHPMYADPQYMDFMKFMSSPARQMQPWERLSRFAT